MIGRPPNGSGWFGAVILLLLVFSGCTSDEPERSQLNVESFNVVASVTSPDQSLRVEVGTDEAGRPRYRSSRLLSDGREVSVVEESTLGLELTVDGVAVSFAEGGTMSVGETAFVESEFSLPTGKARSDRVDAEIVTVEYRSEVSWPLNIEVWVSNTGFALRYGIDASETSTIATIEWERTSFDVSAEARSWLQPHDPPGFVTPAYERLRSREATAGSPGSAAYGWTFPALFATDDTWTLIHESAPTSADAGSHLSSVTDDGEFFVDLAARGEGNGVGDPRPVVELPWRSPWRIVMNSADVADIVESNLVRHLSASSTPDASWIQPGRVSWSWWSDHESSRDADAMEPFIDLASELGWEYSLIDANWDTFSDERLIELIRYATDRNVGLFLWYNSGGANNVVSEAPRDRMRDEEIRRAEFAHLAELGIAGVKVDFFHSDKPDAMAQYRSILADAAEAKLLVNFHGSTVPRGWSREFPNLMTMEAVRGAEIYTFDPGYAAVAPRQNTVLPFTRNVVGSMDYTPVILGDTVRRVTTNGHELALAVVFESALQHFADTPAAYLEQPAEVVDLLATVPTVWDETRFIDGSPESHVAIARRFQNEWWLGVIAAEGEERTVVVDLAELGIADGTVALRVCDNPEWEGEPGRRETWDDPSQYAIEEGPVSDPLVLTIVPNGGCLIRFDGS